MYPKYIRAAENLDLVRRDLTVSNIVEQDQVASLAEVEESR